MVRRKNRRVYYCAKTESRRIDCTGKKEMQTDRLLWPKTQKGEIYVIRTTYRK